MEEAGCHFLGTTSLLTVPCVGTGGAVGSLEAEGCTVEAGFSLASRSWVSKLLLLSVHGCRPQIPPHPSLSANSLFYMPSTCLAKVPLSCTHASISLLTLLQDTSNTIPSSLLGAFQDLINFRSNGQSGH